MSIKESTTERWRTHTSAEGLTWGMMLDGNVIVDAVRRHARLDGAAILEIGPGYGRFLRSLVAASIPFGSYTGVDISAHWVRELATEFRHPNIEFVYGPAEEADLLLAGRQFDVVVSMLTWKHLYPNFRVAARACRSLLAPNGRLIFDLPETNIAWPVQLDAAHGAFEETGAFTRTYTRDEARSLLVDAGLAVATFDQIEHAPGKRRLLLVANRSP